MVILASTARARPTLSAAARRRREARHRCGHPRPRPQARLLRAGARDARPGHARSWRTCAPPPPTSTWSRSARRWVPSSSPGDDVDKPAGVLSGGEKTRLALATLVVSSANVLLLDEPTNNLDPASREEILGALRTYKGAVVLVTHDEGAVDALEPERIILLPDGVEDLWGPDYADLVALA
ncbi:ATP-binding cassette domain-containing protein [Streptomyces thioluteus]|uniref:ATP-binding cassette domain-containing protein n=1 Tax=Streptomyces thioluteus TaxID=66431 RepID=UPI003CD08F5F